MPIPKPDHVLVIFNQGLEESLWFFHFPNVDADVWKRLSRVHNKFINQDKLDPEIEAIIYDEFYWRVEATPSQQLAEFDHYSPFVGTDSTYPTFNAFNGKIAIIQTGILP